MAKHQSTGFISMILFSLVFLSSLFLVSCISHSVVEIPLIDNKTLSNRIGIVSKSQTIVKHGLLEFFYKTDCFRNLEQSFRSVDLDEMLIPKFRLLFSERGYDLIHIGQEISASDERPAKIGEILVDIGKRNNLDNVLYLSTTSWLPDAQFNLDYSISGDAWLYFDAKIINVETGQVIYHQRVDTAFVDLKDHVGSDLLGRPLVVTNLSGRPMVRYNNGGCEVDRNSLHESLNLQTDYIVSQIGAYIAHK
jgi:hypothetical protein